MKLLEITQCNLDKDVYFMEVFPGKIVINDDYEGIMVLDDRLNVIEKIGLEDIVVDASFKNALTEELAVFFHDDKRLFYFDLKSMAHKVCDIEGDLPVLSKYHVWGSDEIVFVTYDGEFYRYGTRDNAFHRIEQAYVKEKYDSFYAFWEETKDLPVVRYDAEKSEIIVNTRNNRYYVYQSGRDKIFLTSAYKPHDVDFSGNAALFIQENIIELADQTERITIAPGGRMAFLRGGFLGRGKIAVLCSHNDDLISQITVYQLTD
ncbi:MULTISPECIES: hypothetical protein [Bacillus]|uniref:Uncharacterized protein n=1 Tax=Bacillus glycinifermentans TaxID=1664069 RepID=A0AAJ3Z264_9BACI|nr:MULTISPECIES: hypothetical protein [Bacillus]KKB75167.1 hypothetical protein TH62_02880 [Bacillus sp. TH008]MDU0071610.1 hypothetical protein [Bacillus sp. IG6]MED8020043.1 hypothetical protein [Bacillus glycinifermentans]QAT67547.1 hypothetical protein EQZ20_23455 [Bacillus glycinifermentans]WKB77203.1 hypothetical protein QYM22_23190 [Bacillus glycinifermentans]